MNCKWCNPPFLYCEDHPNGRGLTFGREKPKPAPVVEAVARVSDPNTSHIAAAQVNASGKASERAEKVIRILRRHPDGLTCRGVYRAGVDIDDLGWEVQNVSSLLNQLWKKGYVRKDGTRPDEETGREQIVWKASY